MRWPSACRAAVPELADLSKEPARVYDALRPRGRRSPARSPRTASLPADWPSAVSASSSSIIAAGTNTTTCPTGSASQCYDTDQPTAALIGDLKAARHARRHARHLGGEFGRTVVLRRAC